MRQPIPLSERKLDWYFIIFFIVNFSFITYIVDIEQIIIADPNDFEYPLWPPKPFVDLIHWWGYTYDPLLMARPAWWRATRARSSWRSATWCSGSPARRA